MRGCPVCTIYRVESFMSLRVYRHVDSPRVVSILVMRESTFPELSFQRAFAIYRYRIYLFVSLYFLHFYTTVCIIKKKIASTDRSCINPLKYAAVGFFMRNHNSVLHLAYVSP